MVGFTRFKAYMHLGMGLALVGLVGHKHKRAEELHSLVFVLVHYGFFRTGITLFSLAIVSCHMAEWWHWAKPGTCFGIHDVRDLGAWRIHRQAPGRRPWSGPVGNDAFLGPHASLKVGIAMAQREPIANDMRHEGCQGRFSPESPRFRSGSLRPGAMNVARRAHGTLGLPGCRFRMASLGFHGFTRVRPSPYR